jgi:flagellar hook-associated protein 3 FlgL
MRVTQSMGYSKLLRDIGRLQERMHTAQEQISSGKKFSSPSDNPSVASDILRLGGEKMENEQYARNMVFAKSKLEVADGVLDGVEKMVERALTLGQLSLGNATSAAAYMTEVSGLRDQIIGAANTVHAGRFLFAGTRTTTAPYVKAADSTVTYQGNDEDMPLQVSRTSTLQAQIPGSEIFSGSVDIFATMSDLLTAMQSGSRSNIDAQLKKMQEFAEVLSLGRSRIGGTINLATSIESELSTSNLARETELNEAQAADLARSISELTMNQNSLEATMAVGARISQLNILDYL